MAQQVTGGDLVAAALEALGVEHVFGIVSVHNLPIYDAIRRRGRITAINSRHEQDAVHAADGYARTTGRLGVAITSTGPGAANAVPGLYEAAFSSSPVLMITGQVETRFYGKGRGVLHEAEQPAAHAPQRDAADRERGPGARTSRRHHARRGRRADRPPAARRRRDPHRPAVPAAPRRSGRSGPRSAVPGPSRPPWPRPPPSCRPPPRPLIWAGGGVVAAGASAELTALAERLQAPVVTTIEGRGAIAEDHPLAVGPQSDHAEVSAVIADADVVLAVGSRFPAHRRPVGRPAAPAHSPRRRPAGHRAEPPGLGRAGRRRAGRARGPARGGHRPRGGAGVHQARPGGRRPGPRRRAREDRGRLPRHHGRHPGGAAPARPGGAGLHGARLPLGRPAAADPRSPGPRCGPTPRPSAPASRWPSGRPSAAASRRWSSRATAA